MELNYSAFATMLLIFALLSVIMARMAGRRGLSRLPFVVLAFVPIVNLVALLGLALKPKLNEASN